MTRVLLWRHLVAVAALAPFACRAQGVPNATSAYVVALRSVLVDVRGNPPGGPLLLDSLSATRLDSATLHDLAAAGVLESTCGRLSRWTFGCATEQRGLYLTASRLVPLASGHIAVNVMVQGRAAPGDHTAIVGQPYRAYIEMAPVAGGWRIVKKERSGGPGARAV